MEKEHSKKPKDVVNGLIDERSKGKISKAVAKTIVNALLASHSGRAAQSYGALGSLLYGPVVRGGEAS